jgi:hypothetical protein
MTLIDARDVLDAVRSGSSMASEAEITEALRATGDLEFDLVIRTHRPAGTWETILPSQIRRPDPLGSLLVSCPRTLARALREAA